MQTIALQHAGINNLSTTGQSTNNLIDVSEENRFGVSASLILLQISIAGFNVVIPSMAGASIWLMVPGITMAFLSNSFAMAQMKMKWVLPGFVLSILINAAVSVYSLFYLF